MAATDAQFRYGQGCKGSWGASLLYQMTGEPQYEAFIHRVGDWYVTRQASDGWWAPESARQEPAGRGDRGHARVVTHLDTLLGGLASRPPEEPRRETTAAGG